MMDFVEDDELYEHFRIEVDKGQEPVRIDKYLSEHQPHSSRNRIQKAADAGFIHVNGRPVKSNYKVRAGDVVTLMLDRPHYDTTIWSSTNRQVWWYIRAVVISTAHW